eukprot:1118855-Amphidinium_carterae.1
MRVVQRARYAHLAQASQEARSAGVLDKWASPGGIEYACFLFHRIEGDSSEKRKLLALNVLLLLPLLVSNKTLGTEPMTKTLT